MLHELHTLLQKYRTTPGGSGDETKKTVPLFQNEKDRSPVSLEATFSLRPGLRNYEKFPETIAKQMFIGYNCR